MTLKEKMDEEKSAVGEKITKSYATRLQLIIVLLVQMIKKPLELALKT